MGVLSLSVCTKYGVSVGGGGGRGEFSYFLIFIFIFLAVKDWVGQSTYSLDSMEAFTKESYPQMPNHTYQFPSVEGVLP